MIGRWDPDARRFIAAGWVWGPAGPASVDVSPSVRLTVDYANPDVTSEITIDAPVDVATQRVAAALLGPEALGRLLALAESQPSGRSARISEDEDSRHPLGRFAVLIEIATDPDASPAKAGRAAEEALSIARSDGLLSTIVDGSLLGFLRGITELNDDLGYQPTVAAAAPAATKMAMAADMLVEPVAGRIGPEIETDGPASARLVRPTEIEVRGGEGWTRVFRRRDRLMLALAPLRDMPTLIVIPSGCTPDDLIVDITDDPAAARPSDQLLLVRAAVTAGREACRHERLGSGDASHHWIDSASAWDGAGSRERAETAREYAAGARQGGRGTRPRRQPQGPFLADRVP